MNESDSTRGVENERSGMPSPLRLLLHLAVWLMLYAILLTVYNATYHITSDVVIRWLQIMPAVKILEATLPDMAFTCTSTAIHSPQLELQILRGCDGMEVWLMLIAALLVFPMPWHHRFKGVLWGTALIYSLNMARIVSLFHIVLKKPEWFELAHGVVWQSIIVLAAAVFVLSWMNPVRVTHPVGGPTEKGPV